MRKILGLFTVLLINAYACGLAVCDDSVSETYTVRLNGIPFRSDVAEGILLRINSDYKHKGIRAFDKIQNKNISLTKIEKNMNITIEDSELLAELSDLYTNRLNTNMNTHRNTQWEKCVGRNLEFNKGEKTIEMCIDTDDNKVSYLLICK
jgi:hypothetical protein